MANVKSFILIIHTNVSRLISVVPQVISVPVDHIRWESDETLSLKKTMINDE